jgi:ribosomal protein S18 acetylase RimI-like enzyme
LRLFRELVRVTGFTRIVQVLRAFNEIEKRHPTESHYYALAIGVDEGQQGKGVGTLLMNEMLAQADAAGMPSYLESTNERNNPLYERLGFEVTETIVLPHGGPRMWCMWRKPRP